MDRRRKDTTWTVNTDTGTVTFDGAQLAVLMDIRDELKKLNTVFQCRNFQNIPRKLDRISANTYKPKKRKAKPCPTE